MLLTIVAIGISAFDIILRAVQADPKGKKIVIIAGSSYLLMVRLIVLYSSEYSGFFENFLFLPYFKYHFFDRVLLP